MNTRLPAACAILLSILSLGTAASAHRLDEYLQATTISVERDRIQAQIRLTPGVAVFPKVFASIDTNGDGTLSAAEQRAYAEKVLRDLSLTLDGGKLRLQLAAWKFSNIAEMKAGRGEIQIDFDAEVPRSNRNRKLIFTNRHQSGMAVYLVNCLVPRDPNIQVTAQHRNYQQSVYQLDYVQASAPVPPPTLAQHSGGQGWLGAAALLLFAPLAWLWRHVRAGKDVIAQREQVSTRETVSPEGRAI
jgi:Tfp pilus assembly protein FimT